MESPESYGTGTIPGSPLTSNRLRVLLAFPAVVMGFIISAYALYAWLRPGRAAASRRRPRPAAFNVITSASSLLDTNGNMLTPWTGSRAHAPKMNAADNRTSDPEGWFNLLLVLTLCYVCTAAYYNRLSVGHWMTDQGAFLVGLSVYFQARECRLGGGRRLCGISLRNATRRTLYAMSPSSAPSSAPSPLASSALSSRACRPLPPRAPRSCRCRRLQSWPSSLARSPMRTRSTSGR